MQNWIADSYAEIQACRLMTLDAAHKIDGGDEARVEISAIKFFAAGVLHDVIDRAVQVHGARGLTDETPLANMLIQARGARIYDGPDEVHRMVVARRILKSFENGDGWLSREEARSRAAARLVSGAARSELPPDRRPDRASRRRRRDGARAHAVRPTCRRRCGALARRFPGADGPVFVGGPVQPEAFMVLAEFTDPTRLPCRSSAASASCRPRPSPRSSRSGASASSPATPAGAAGQLEAELAEPSWIVIPARADDPFADDPDELWRDVLKRGGGKYSLMDACRTTPA